MEKIFDCFKGMLIKHDNYEGVLCGYNDEHFIIAVEKHPDISFRKLPKSSVLIKEYTSTKYRYIYENECELIKQFKK